MSANREQPKSNGTRTLSSATRALALLEALAEHRRPVRPPVLARQLGWGRATLHQHLTTFVSAGWLEQLPDGSYRLTLRASRLGHAALEQASIGERILPVMQRLTAESREMSFLSVLDRDAAHVVERVEPDRRVRAHLDGQTRWSLDESASGAVFVAFGEAAVMAELEAQGVKMPPAREIAKVRRDGFAVSPPPAEGEEGDGIVAIAVPLRDERGVCVAALGLIGPESRFDVEEGTRRLIDAGRSLDNMWLEGAA